VQILEGEDDLRSVEARMWLTASHKQRKSRLSAVFVACFTNVHTIVQYLSLETISYSTVGSSSIDLEQTTAHGISHCQTLT